MTTSDVDTIGSGELVRLRVKRIEDAHQDWVWRSDVELAELDGAPVTRLTYEQYRNQYQWQLKRSPSARTTFAVETLGGVHIGNVMYYNVDASGRDAELGVVIGDREYWGAGYGREAVRLLVDHVFTATQLTRVYLHTLDWNLRAQKAFQAVGFRECGILHRGHNRFHRMEIRREWLWERHYQAQAVPQSRSSRRGRRWGRKRR